MYDSHNGVKMKTMCEEYTNNITWKCMIMEHADMKESGKTIRYYVVLWHEQVSVGSQTQNITYMYVRRR